MIGVLWDSLVYLGGKSQVGIHIRSQDFFGNNCENLCILQILVKFFAES